jgi:predicted enzyme related to lactoylglutathione lyase
MKKNHPWLLFSALALVLAVVAACSSSGGARLADVPLSNEPLTGKFIWHDLITDDLDQAKRFYGGLFGWSFEDTTHPNGGDYTVITTGDRYVGGMVQLADPAGADYSRWLGYLSVRDVDRAVDFNRAQGGAAAAGPLELPGLGRAAVIQDPQTAVVGLLSSDHGDPDDSLEPGPGLVVWNEMLASDDEKAVGFYATLAGYDALAERRERGVYHFLLSQGQKRAAVMQRPTDDVKPFWLTHFGVDDVAQATKRSAELGGTVLLAPDPGFRQGLLAVVVDPNGAILALHQWSE